MQASAADWAAVWLSGVRRDLAAVPDADLVLFLHDELVVQAPAEQADAVIEVVTRAAADAGRLVFPGSPVVIPVVPVAVRCYADAK